MAWNMYTIHSVTYKLVVVVMVVVVVVVIVQELVRVEVAV